MTWSHVLLEGVVPVVVLAIDLFMVMLNAIGLAVIWRRRMHARRDLSMRNRSTSLAESTHLAGPPTPALHRVASQTQLGRAHAAALPGPGKGELAAAAASQQLNTIAGVSILRPLKGVDINMEGALTSAMLQHYPRFEVLFSVASEKDPCVPLVQEIMSRYPEVDARLIVGDVPVGVNPKVCNLIKSYREAKYDILWVLDSNVQVQPGCLARSVEALQQPDVGLVHHLPIIENFTSMGAAVHAAFINATHAKMYTAINWFGIASCIVGKSNLYRKSDVERVGGLAHYAQFLSEDNLLATAIFKDLGKRHVMTYDLARQQLGYMTPEDDQFRRMRWIRIRKYTVVAATLFEPFTESLFIGPLAGWAVFTLFGFPRWLFVVLHTLAWFCVDLRIASLLWPGTTRYTALFALAWFQRESSAMLMWILAWLADDVAWRGQRFRLKRDGTAELIPPQQPTAAKSGLARWIPTPLTRLGDRAGILMGIALEMGGVVLRRDGARELLYERTRFTRRLDKEPRHPHHHGLPADGDAAPMTQHHLPPHHPTRENGYRATAPPPDAAARTAAAGDGAAATPPTALSSSSSSAATLDAGPADASPAAAAHASEHESLLSPASTADAGLPLMGGADKLAAAQRPRPVTHRSHCAVERLFVPTSTDSDMVMQAIDNDVDHDGVGLYWRTAQGSTRLTRRGVRYLVALSA